MEIDFISTWHNRITFLSFKFPVGRNKHLKRKQSSVAKENAAMSDDVIAF